MQNLQWFTFFTPINYSLSFHVIACSFVFLLWQVTLWLKRIYGNVPVPKYEVNERTVDILHDVMKCSEERDKDIMLLIEDMKYWATKYEAESEFEAPFLSSIRVRLFLVILKIVFVKKLGICINICN